MTGAPAGARRDDAVAELDAAAEREALDAYSRTVTTVAERRHDAGRDGAAEAVRIPDRDDQLADA